VSWTRRTQDPRRGFVDAKLKRALMQVADGGGKRVGGVRRERAAETEKRPHHLLHLLFARVAVADDGLLDLYRRILVKDNILLRGREERDTARLTELERTEGVLREKDFFEADTVGAVPRDDFTKSVVNALEAHALRLPCRTGDRAVIDVHERAARHFDHAPTGRDRARIDS